MDLPAHLVAHPLVDAVGRFGLITRAGAPVVALSADRAELLTAASAANVPVTLRTPSAARLTESMRAALQDASGSWIVERADGERWNAATGRILLPGADDTEPAPPDAQIAADFAAGTPADALHLVVAASVRHRPDDPAEPGRLLEHLLAALGLRSPGAAGPCEPAVELWDPARLAATAARRRGLERTLIVGTPGHPLAGSVSMRPTRLGFEEVLEAVLPVGPVGDEAAVDRTATAVRSAFDRTARTELPLFAVALLRPGRADLQASPTLAHPATPLAAMIGPAGVRAMRLEPAALAARFGAETVGRPRTPALYVPFGGRLDGWRAVAGLVDAVGSERVAAAFGVPGG